MARANGCAGAAHRWVLALGLSACGGNPLRARGDAEPTIASPAEPQGTSDTPTITDGNRHTPLELAASGQLADLVEELKHSLVAIGTVSGNTLFGGARPGSGIVVDREGHILTKFHVVEHTEGSR